MSQNIKELVEKVSGMKEPLALIHPDTDYSRAAIMLLYVAMSAGRDIKYERDAFVPVDDIYFIDKATFYPRLSPWVKWN